MVLTGQEDLEVTLQEHPQTITGMTVGAGIPEAGATIMATTGLITMIGIEVIRTRITTATGIITML